MAPPNAGATTNTGKSTRSQAPSAAVSAGVDHNCGLRTDGTIECWGDNRYGQSEAPVGAYTSVSAGFEHTCAVRSDQTLRCWGNSEDGRTDAPAGTFTAVSAGGEHSCGLRTDGTLHVLEPALDTDTAVRSLDFAARTRQRVQRLFHRRRRRRGAGLRLRPGGGRSGPGCCRLRGARHRPLRDGLSRRHACLRPLHRRDGGLLGQQRVRQGLRALRRVRGGVGRLVALLRRAPRRDHRVLGQRPRRKTRPARRDLHVGVGGDLAHMRAAHRRHRAVLGRPFPATPSHRPDSSPNCPPPAISPAACAPTAPSNAGASVPASTRPQGRSARCRPATSTHAVCGPAGPSNAGATTSTVRPALLKERSCRCRPATTTPAQSETTVQRSAGDEDVLGALNDFWPGFVPGTRPIRHGVRRGHGRLRPASTDGTVSCWGHNDAAASEPPAGGFMAVSAGSVHTCGLRPGGSAECWQHRTLPDPIRRRPPSPGSRPASVHTCGLRSRRRRRMLGRQPTQRPVRSDSPTRRRTASRRSPAAGLHTCGLTVGGSVAVLGQERLRPVRRVRGDPSLRCRPGRITPAACAPAARPCAGASNQDNKLDAPEGSFSTVSAGVWQSCGVLVDGDIRCWGGLGVDPEPYTVTGPFEAAATGQRLLVQSAHRRHSLLLGLDSVRLHGAPSRHVQHVLRRRAPRLRRAHRRHRRLLESLPPRIAPTPSDGPERPSNGDPMIEHPRPAIATVARLGVSAVWVAMMAAACVSPADSAHDALGERPSEVVVTAT